MDERDPLAWENYRPDTKVACVVSGFFLLAGFFAPLVTGRGFQETVGHYRPGEVIGFVGAAIIWAVWAASRCVEALRRSPRDW